MTEIIKLTNRGVLKLTAGMNRDRHNKRSIDLNPHRGNRIFKHKDQAKLHLRVLIRDLKTAHEIAAAKVKTVRKKVPVAAQRARNVVNKILQ